MKNLHQKANPLFSTEMPSTRRQKTKTRKSRDADLLSDIENLDVMLGSPHFGDIEGDIRDGFEDRNERQSTSQENEIRSENRSDGHMHPSVTENIERRFENMTSEMKTRLSQEKDGLMFSLNTQIQRALDSAVNSQLIPQIQSSIRAATSEQP